MEKQWKQLGKPAAVGFVVGLVLMAGLAILAPRPDAGERPVPADQAH